MWQTVPSFLFCSLYHYWSPLLYRDDAGDDGSQFSTVFNEENRHTPLNQTELLKFSTHVAKFSGKIANPSLKKTNIVTKTTNITAVNIGFLKITCEVMLTRFIYIHVLFRIILKEWRETKCPKTKINNRTNLSYLYGVWISSISSAVLFSYEIFLIKLLYLHVNGSCWTQESVLLSMYHTCN